MSGHSPTTWSNCCWLWRYKDDGRCPAALAALPQVCLDPCSLYATLVQSPFRNGTATIVTSLACPVNKIPITSRNDKLFLPPLPVIHIIGLTPSTIARMTASWLPWNVLDNAYAHYLVANGGEPGELGEARCSYARATCPNEKGQYTHTYKHSYFHYGGIDAGFGERAGLHSYLIVYVYVERVTYIFLQPPKRVPASSRIFVPLLF